MFAPIIALKRFVASRMLLSSAPRAPWHTRLRGWAAMNASEAAHHRLTSRLYEYQRLTGQRAILPLDVAATSGLLTADGLMAAGHGISQPNRLSAQYPTLAGLGYGRHIGLRRLPKPTPMNIRRFCFAADTDVLTKRGWVSVGALLSTDTLATYNMQTGGAEWQQLTTLHRYRVDGRLLRFESRDVDALVTPEHKMLGRFRKNTDIGNVRQCPECGQTFVTSAGCGSHRRRAHGVRGGTHPVGSYRYSDVRLWEATGVRQWLTRHRSQTAAFEIPFRARWTGQLPVDYDSITETVPVCVNGATVRVVLKDLVAFLGLYVAEGCVEGSWAGIDGAVTSAEPPYVQAQRAALVAPLVGSRVSIAQTEQGKWTEVDALLARLPWRFRAQSDRRSFEAWCPDLHAMLAPLGNTYTMRVPAWIKDLPPELIRVFLEWAILGDGHVRSDGGRWYCTVSQQLADDVHELFQRSGSAARVSVKAPRGSAPWGVPASRCAPQYIVTEKTRAFYGVHAQHITEEDYHGDVFCPDVPNKTVYVRRNGKAFWCGRSETPPGRRAINKVKNDVLRLDWEIAPRDERYRKSPGKQSDRVPLDMQGRIDAVTRALQHPNRESSYYAVMQPLVEDVLVGGFGSWETRRWEGNEMQPFRVWPVDGMSVRINMDWGGDDCDDPHRRFRYSQALAFGGAVVQTNQRVELYDRDLMYVRYDARSSTPFGLGPLETAYQMVNAWLGHFDSRERMESNDVPPFLIALGKNMSPTDVYAFRNYWETDVEGQGKIPIIGGQESPEAIMLRQRQMGTSVNAWPEIVLRMIAISFGLAPQTFGIEKDVNRNTSEVMQSEEFTDSVLPVTKAIEDAITQHILYQLCGWEDLEFKFKITAGDEAQAVANAVQLYNADVVKLNEAREHAQLDPLPPDDPRGNLFLSEFRSQQQTQAAAAQAALAPPAAAPMAPDDPRARLQEEQQAPPEAKAAATDGATRSDDGAVILPLPPNALPGTPLHHQIGALMALAELVRGDARVATLDAAADDDDETPRIIELTSQADFDTLTALVATHRNGHA